VQSVATQFPTLGWLAPLLADVLVRVVRIAALVAVGVFVANLAVAFGLVERVAGLSRYLTGPANLPDEVGTAIVTTAASTTAGYGMLADFREAGTIDDRATLVAVTINTFFGFVQHVFTFYAPVLIPILGLEVGLLYVGARAGVALAITLVGVIAGVILLPGTGAGRNPTTASGAADPADEAERPSRTAGENFADAGRKTASRLRRIVPRLVVVYALVALLVERVDLSGLTGAADPLATTVGLPIAAIPAVAVFALDTTAGAAAVAPLVGDVLTPKQAVAAMLLGGILSFGISTFKRSIPFQYGVWGPEFGSKVIAVNTALKVVFLGVALAAFLVP
jgi:hypothetical protein